MGNVRMRAEQINYGATNVKVALDDLDPAALIALNNRMNRIDAWKATVKTEEKTGADVTFTNALALAAVSLSAEIEAIQDLHGYDKPWVGGAGKNRLPLTVDSIKEAAGSGWNDDNEKTINGIKYTIVTDAANNVIGIKADGTASALSQLKIARDMSVTTGQIGSLMTSSVNGVSFTLWKNNDADNVARIYGGDVTINETVSGVSAYIGITNGTHIDNLMLYPMIRDASAPSGFAPYSNICPISGHSSVTITRTDAESQTADFTIQLGQTVYGGSLNLTTGVLTVTHANIASYNGETINEPWISSLDEYTQGGTPTTGAQVVYTLAAPTTIQLIPEQLTMLKGYNRISADTGDITVEAYTGAAWGGDE